MFWWCGGIPFCPTHHGNFDEVLGERDGFLLLFPSDRICVETAMKTEGATSSRAVEGNWAGL